MVIFAYLDSDMDGVEDRDDLCADTPLTDLVDLSGCTIEHLLSPHHFSLMAGMSYADDNDAIYNFSSFEFDYYYENFSLQLAASYYRLEANGLNQNGENDTYLNLFYRINLLKDLSLTLGTGIILPTYNSIDNRTDYSSSIYGRYQIDNWSFSTGVGYTFIGDQNASNRVFFNLNTGYSWSKRHYSSIGYYFSETIYEGIGDFESLLLYHYYSIDDHWFITLNATEGLSSASLENSVGVKVGYYW